MVDSDSGDDPNRWISKQKQGHAATKRTFLYFHCACPVASAQAPETRPANLEATARCSQCEITACWFSLSRSVICYIRNYIYLLPNLSWTNELMQATAAGLCLVLGRAQRKLWPDKVRKGSSWCENHIPGRKGYQNSPLQHQFNYQDDRNLSRLDTIRAFQISRI